jgi:hypothetical protein
MIKPLLTTWIIRKKMAKQLHTQSYQATLYKQKLRFIQ